MIVKSSGRFTMSKKEFFEGVIFLIVFMLVVLVVCAIIDPYGVSDFGRLGWKILSLFK